MCVCVYVCVYSNNILDQVKKRHMGIITFSPVYVLQHQIFEIEFLQQ